MIFQKKIILSETWTHPPTSIVNSDFLNFFFFAKPVKRVRLWQVLFVLEPVPLLRIDPDILLTGSQSFEVSYLYFSLVSGT